MASSRWTEEDLARVTQRHKAINVAPVADAKPAPNKYHNRVTYAENIRFDSQREASYWIELRMRERAGDLWELKRQVEFELTCAAADGTAPVVCVYRADFTYTDKTGSHVVDAKGKRTQMYALKKKWLLLQLGITIEEV